MPEGHETRETFIVNEMCMKAHRSRNVDSLQKAIRAAREQGLGQSILCMTCEFLLQKLNKKHELYEGEWQHWAEINEEPFEHTFRNWATGETRREEDASPKPALEPTGSNRIARDWNFCLPSTLTEASPKRPKPTIECTGSNRLAEELCRDQLPFIPETPHAATASSSSEMKRGEDGRTWHVTTGLGGVAVTEMARDDSDSNWL